MKKIRITKKQIVLVDDEDYKKLSKIKWHAIQGTAGRTHYAHNTEKGLMHRFIVGLSRGDKQCTDHINFDGLDNRKENLRICSKSENNIHSRIHRKCSSQYRGVHKKKDSAKKSRWYAGIVFNKKHISIGRFPTELEAAVAYDKVAEQYYGDFAPLNFPTKD